LGIQLFHGTDFAVPYIPMRASVMTVHDLSPWLYPDWQPAAKRVRERTPMLLKAGLANMVITPSQAVRAQAIQYFKLPANRVVAIPLAAADCFRPRAAVPHTTPFFLYAGTLEPRKNVARIIEAWRHVRTQKKVDLILAGRIREDFGPLQPEAGLQHLDQPDDDTLAQLYTSASAVVYPSSYEGFGLPVLEAMQCGALVLTSHDPAIGEITGTSDQTASAIRVDQRDTRGLAQAMLAAVREPNSFLEIRQRALKRAAAFSWAQTAKQTREVYEQAARLFSHT
jgi:glycosyltransferase involved in cell wall biosynthesis